MVFGMSGMITVLTGQLSFTSYSLLLKGSWFIRRNSLRCNSSLDAYIPDEE